MPDQPDKIADKLGVNAPNSQVNIENMFVGSAPDSTVQKEQLVDWQKICRDMLVERQQLTSNRLMVSPDMHKDLDIFVDLALVQQRKADKRDEDVLPEHGSQLYEPSRYSESERFEFNRFLSDVLGEQKNEKLTIVGEPGCGKTTLLQKIAFWLLDNTEDLVIWVSLGELKEKSLRDYLTEDWLQEAVMYSDSTILENWQGQFLRRRVWLLLDGLDEMTPETRDALSLRGWVSQARVILTCRLNVWQTNPRIIHGFEIYRMLEFRSSQIEEFIQKWFVDDKALGKRLYQALEQPRKERIKDLVRNPLRLTLLCSTWHLRDGELPSTRAELYAQFVDDLYAWKSERFPTTETDRYNLNQKLGELAKKAIDTELTRFRLRHDLVCLILGEPGAEGSMLDLALELGWLNAVGIDPDNPRKPVYAFFHATFQEYFAANLIDDWTFFLPSNGREALANTETSIIENTYRIFEPQWQEVFLLWLGRKEIKIGTKNDFIEALFNFEDGCGGFYEYSAFFLGTLGALEYSGYLHIEDALKRLSEWAFGKLCAEGSRFTRYFKSIEKQAEATLLGTNSHATKNTLSELLKCPTEQKRVVYRIANLLLKIDLENKLAINILIELLESVEPDWGRLEIASSLFETKLGKNIAERTLIKLLENSDDEWVKLEAALTLLAKDKEHPDAINSLISLLCTSSDRSILLRLKLDKVNCNNPKIIKSLIKMSYMGKSQVSRSISLDYLARILAKNQQIIERISQIVAIPGFALKLLTEKDNSIQTSGIQFLQDFVGLIDASLLEETKAERRQNFWELFKVAARKPDIILLMVDIGEYNKKAEALKKDVFELFNKLGIEIEYTVPVGIDIVNKIKHVYLRALLARKMAFSGFEDPAIPNLLTELLDHQENKNDESVQIWLAEALLEYEPGNPKAIKVFVELLISSPSWNTCLLASKHLGKAANHKSYLAKSLFDLFIESNKDDTIESITYGVKEIFSSDPLKILVFEFKKHLNQEVKETNYFLYAQIFEIVWHCASRLSYSEFYEVWTAEHLMLAEE